MIQRKLAKKTSLLASFLGIVSVAGGCAQQPVKDSPRVVAQAAHWGVSPYLLVTAENHGYWPQMHENKVAFCKSSAVVGSNIASLECLDPKQIIGRLGREEDEERRSRDMLEKGSGLCPPGRPAC